MSRSPYEQLKALPREARLSKIAALPDEVCAEMLRLPWWLMARPEQLQPAGDWNIWLMLAGRGFGKTRACAEWLVEQVLAQPFAPDGVPTEWAIIAETFADCRVLCVEGPSGLLRALQRRGLEEGRDFTYSKSMWQIRINTGQVIHMIGADDPDAGRGYNLAGAWLDELAKWKYPYETWTEGIAPSLRIGTHPRCVVATTPKPIKLLKEWVKRTDGSVTITRGSTFDNASNLSQTALLELKARYEGTRIGQQELFGVLLEDVEGALWKSKLIEDDRLTREQWERIKPTIVRRVVAIDPAVTKKDGSNETGIMVMSRDRDGQGYLEADLTVKGTPQEWAEVAVAAFDEYEADLVIAETNQGGDMVEHTLRTVRQNIPFKGVSAHKGKRLRAEPVSSMAEQHRIHHVGTFGMLESQMTTWLPDDPESPDRLDAYVHGMTELLISASGAEAYLRQLAAFCPRCQQPNIRERTSCAHCGAALHPDQAATVPLGMAALMGARAS